MKKDVARGLGLPQHVFLESWITSIAVLRNCCAHHARTWNRTFTIKPQLPSTLSGDWILDRSMPPYKIYPMLCCIQYLLNTIGVGDEFNGKLKELIAQYSNVDVTAMGFSTTWEKEPLWQKVMNPLPSICHNKSFPKCKNNPNKKNRLQLLRRRGTLTITVPPISSETAYSTCSATQNTDTGKGSR